MTLTSEGSSRIAITALVACLGAGLPSWLSAQDGSRDRDPPPVTLSAGVGNSWGWVGGRVDRSLFDGRGSAFLGLGYSPTETLQGATFASGVRAFVMGGERHRGFLELSVSQILIESRRYFGAGAPPSTDRSYYGPGLQAGYQYTAGNGFTALLSAGAGYAVGGVADSTDRLAFLFGLGVGYTIQ